MSKILETQNYVICSNVFVKKENKFLMLKRSSKKNILPAILHPIGGKVDKFETPIKAMHRELFEETGLKVRNVQLKAILFEVVLEKSEKEPYDWMNYYFVADYIEDDVVNSDEGEFLWLDLDEIKNESILPSIRATIELMLDSKASTLFAKFEYDKNDNIVNKELEILN